MPIPRSHLGSGSTGRVSWRWTPPAGRRGLRAGGGRGGGGGSAVLSRLQLVGTAVPLSWRSCEDCAAPPGPRELTAAAAGPLPPPPPHPTPAPRPDLRALSMPGAGSWPRGGGAEPRPRDPSQRSTRRPESWHPCPPRCLAEGGRERKGLGTERGVLVKKSAHPPVLSFQGWDLRSGWDVPGTVLGRCPMLSHQG